MKSHISIEVLYCCLHNPGISISGIARILNSTHSHINNLCRYLRKQNMLILVNGVTKRERNFTINPIYKDEILTTYNFLKLIQNDNSKV